MIPPDEVVTALRNVQGLLPIGTERDVRGGLGATETAARLKGWKGCAGNGGRRANPEKEGWIRG